MLEGLFAFFPSFMLLYNIYVAWYCAFKSQGVDTPSFHKADLCETTVNFRIQKSVLNFNIFIVFAVFLS